MGKNFIHYTEVIKKIENYNINDLYYDSKRHTINSLKDNQKIIRLPLIWPQFNKILEYKKVISENIIYLVFIIRSEQASIGIFKDGKVIKHKVFRTYSVRKKQGKSQIKYLKTKGKSRAGSRVRLNNIENFIKEITDYINLLIKNFNIDRYIYFLPIILNNIFFNSKYNLLIDKNSSKLIKIPYNIGDPNFKLLKKIGKYSLDGEIFID